MIYTSIFIKKNWKIIIWKILETWIIYKNLSSREEEIRIGNLKDKNLERRGRSKVWNMENLKVETIEMSKIGNNGKLIL